MSNFPEKKIFEEADNWIKNNKKVSLATVVQTWGSSPVSYTHLTLPTNREV